MIVEVGLGLLALDALVWMGALAGALKSSGAAFSLDGDVQALETWPSVSVVIPARNEEGFVGKAVQAVLRQDYPELSLVVVDDDSSDNTAAEATEAADSDPRFALKQGGPLEDPSWKGKPRVCSIGSKGATTDYLLFVDADVTLKPDAVKKAIAKAEAEELDLLSVWGEWRLETFWEYIAQPVVGGFVRGSHPLEKMNDHNSPEAFANGQFILFRRSSYEDVGGHELVKSEVLEDVEFARRSRAAGLRCGMFLGHSIFSVRLYTSLGDLFDGYVKNFYHGMRGKAFVGVVAALFVFVMGIAPYLLMGLGGLNGDALLGGVAGAICLLITVTRFIQDRHLDIPRWSALLHPLGAFVLIAIIVTSTVRGMAGSGTSWKGRTVN